MSRLPAISDADASPLVKEIFAGARDCLGWVSNCTRTVAHSPWVAEWWVPFVAAVEKEGGGKLGGRYKQLAVLKTSSINACAYCTGHAHSVGQAVGLNEEEIAAVEGDYEGSPLFSEDEKSVLRWAELVTRNQARRDTECWERLERRFSPQELVELTAVICLFNMMNRFTEALRVNLDDHPGGNRTTRASPNALKDYALRVLAR
jgi:uncharacterized peroxidase-related enzyme